MARVVNGFYSSFTCTRTRLSTNGMSQLVLIYRPRMDGKLCMPMTVKHPLTSAASSNY